MQVATYERLHVTDADEVDNQPYGIAWMDGTDVLVEEWFKTFDERELRIDEVMGFQSDYRAEHGVTQ